MSNSTESTFKQNSDKRFSTLARPETFIGCFIHNAFLIDNAFLNKKEVYSSISKLSTLIR